MVSYYNHSFSMYQKGANISYTPSTSWYPTNYHATGAQFLPNGDTSATQQLYYSHVFHQPSPDWPTHESFASAAAASNSQNGFLQSPLGIVNSHHAAAAAAVSSVPEVNHNLIHSIPSPPITVAGSDIGSTPPVPASSASPQTNGRQTQSKSPYEWMKKSSYQSQPTPDSMMRYCSSSNHQNLSPRQYRKTRTKDKYRVVYSDHQRLELEKEFHYTRYITIRRKSELAQALQLSERQVKIWFQNRRAKDRKQKKKMDNTNTCALSGSNNSVSMTMPKYLDVNTKIEPFHLQHLQQMGIGVGLHSSHHHLHHSNLDNPSVTHPHALPVTSTPLSINNNP